MYWLLAVLVLAVLIFSHRYAWWRPAVPYSKPRILMYHMVCAHKAKAKYNKLRVPPAAFEAQLKWLSEQGWHFAGMSDLAIEKNLPAKTVVLTFDDGYEDNLLQATPILEKYNARATLYLVVDRFNQDWSSKKKAHHNDKELMAEKKLDDDQVRDILSSGIWELGAHTLSHANLARLSHNQKKREISDSRQQLETLFKTPVNSFAYPFGIYNTEDRDITQAAGFSTAVTTNQGIDEHYRKNPLELSRIKVSGRDSMLAFKIRIRSGLRGWK